MKTLIDAFYQGEGIAALEHLEIGGDETFGALRAAIAKKHGASSDARLFFEDEPEPIGDDVTIASKAGRSGIKVHLHRCREIKVTVHFKDKSVHDKFAPGTTIAKVEHWAAVEKFHMTEEEASHHHIGTLVTSNKCAVEFDLVSTPRVNG
jgi:hypothetical protein